MNAALRKGYADWKADPRRWRVPYMLSRIPAILRAWVSTQHADKAFEPLDPPVETGDMNILLEPAFRHSVAQVKEYTCLDEARLANLWNMVRTAGPGLFLEVGSYRGGTALHICNAIDKWHPGEYFCSFDPFETGGFQRLSECDLVFKPTDFMDTQFAAVTQLLASKPRATVVRGFFPDAAQDYDLRDIAFCHLDVDIYDSTIRSLEFLAPRLSPNGLIVLDDYRHRETPGVEKATQEFISRHPSFVCIPMFPCQAVLLPKTLWP
jgi:O-methyltransferase